MDDLAGRTAVITGGASGIGLATARALRAEGMHVVLADVEARALEAAARELDAEPVVCDVSDRDQVEALADRAWERFGGAHVVFNNAGIAVGGPMKDMTHDDWRWVIDVDLWGPIHGVEAFLNRMLESGEPGHLLFSASFAGLAPNVGLGPYCVAKYGVVAMAEVLQKELRDTPLGVSVLCPMRVGTNIGRSERNRQDRYGAADPASLVEDQSDENPDQAGQVLDVADVAAQVVEAIHQDRLYIVPHAEARRFVQNRFRRIERDFDAWHGTGG